MNKKSFIRAASLVAAAGLMSVTAVGTFASYTGTITNQLSGTDKTAVDGVVDKVIDGATDAGFTSVSYLVDKATDANVLSVIVAIGLIYFGGGWAIGWVKSLFKGRKNKKSGVK